MDGPMFWTLWSGDGCGRDDRSHARLCMPDCSFFLVGFFVSIIFLYMDLFRPYACSDRGSGALSLATHISPLSHPIESLSPSLVSFDTSPGSFFFSVLFRVLLAPLCLVFSPLFLFLSVIMIDDYRPFPPSPLNLTSRCSSFALLFLLQ